MINNKNYEEDEPVRNEVINRGIRNIRYTLVAQMLVMGTGILKTLLIPSFLSVDSYGYWQIYLFYLSYIGFFYLGYNDGVLLKYGKYDYDKLPFPLMRSSVRIYIAMLTVFSAMFGLYATTIQDTEKSLIMCVIAASIIMYGINGVLIYIFLITNQIKRYSFFTALDQVAILATAIIIMFAKIPDYRVLVFVSFVSKLIMVLIMMYMCRDIFIGKTEKFALGLKEFFENVKYGISLMLAQIMSMLLTGLGRIFVEYSANIEEYAHYAFGMSVIGVVMVCVTAVSTVMYPMLSRIEKHILPRYFNELCAYITIFNLVAVSAYFPANFFVKLLFPQYESMLSYLFIFFAMFTWQAKINIVTNSYFRVLRKERQMFGINAAGVAFFVVIGLLAVLNSNSIRTVALCTFLTMVFIELISELYLRGQLGLRMSITTLKDIIINTVFMICCISFRLTTGLIVYFIFIIVYIIADRKIVMGMFRKLLAMRKE